MWCSYDENAKGYGACEPSPGYNTTGDGTVKDKVEVLRDQEWYMSLEIAMSSIFLFDYLLNLYLAERRVPHFFSALPILDLFSIIPPFLDLIVDQRTKADAQSTGVGALAHEFNGTSGAAGGLAMLESQEADMVRITYYIKWVIEADMVRVKRNRVVFVLKVQASTSTLEAK